MDVGIIIGEATPLSWPRWRHLCRLVERHQFHSLFRSDHFFNGSQKDAIDVFLSFVMAAEQTSQIRLGPLVSPVTFRHPVHVGRMAQQLDALSEGRFVLGLGAGWHVEEHEVYGIDFPAPTERYDRLEEAIQLMKQLWYSETGTLSGEHYRLSGTDSKPHPPAGRPPILIGGAGPKRTLRIVAESANEWNTTPLDPAGYREAVDALRRHCDTVGRDPTQIRRSMLIFTTLAPDPQTESEIGQRLADMMTPLGQTGSVEQLAVEGRGLWQGSVEQFVDHVGQLAELGLEELVLEHCCHENDEMLDWLATEVKPKIERL